jgi:hypothetical protein
VKLRLGNLTLIWGDKCASEECDYYTHYLRYGNANLPHAAYHQAVKECLEWQRRIMDYLDKNETPPVYVEHMVSKLEKEVRA